MVAILSVLGACGSEPEAPAQVEAPAPTERIVTIERHIASFRDDELDECVDVTIEVHLPLSAPERTPSPFPETPGQIVLQRACEEQFSGRTVLAVCTMSVPVPIQSEAPEAERPTSGTFAVVSRYFRYASVFDNQSFMRDCLTGGGDWQAVAEDSSEYARARLDFHAGSLRGLARHR